MRERVSALQRAKLRSRGVLSIHSDGCDPRDIPRDVVYNSLQAVSVDDSRPTAETCRQADLLFARLQQAAVFKNSKLNDKRAYWRRVLHAAKRAIYHNGCVTYPRNYRHQDFSKARVQVIEAAIDSGLFYEHRSPKGSPKMSRLLPTSKLRKLGSADPWDFDPAMETQFVYLRSRDDKEDISVDLSKLPSWHIASETQDRLRLVNRVNNQYEITCETYSEWERDFTERRQLRPIHYARFTDRWDWHGRLYTGRYGHQSLRKIERRTIQFNGCPSVELDYRGMHPRMLYHLRGIDYDADPYMLWGDDTSPAQRLLAKTLINISFNAATRDAAVNRAKLEMATTTKQKDKGGNSERKHGKRLEDALTLYRAYKQAGLTFDEVYNLAQERHQPIARYFGSDAGIWLMRIDSSIAIDVMYDFAKLCIPCLCCHDSFIVPEHCEQQLREAMNRWYFQRFGFFPVID